MKIFRIAFLESILICSFLLAGSASTSQAYVWHTYNGHEYAVTAYGSWLQAEAEAVSQGGHLVTINDAGENAWVSNTFKDNYIQAYELQPYGAAVYIGYYRISVTPESWGWISGEAASFFNPHSTWNLNYPGPHAYMHTYYNGEPGTWRNLSWFTEGEYENLVMKGVIERPVPIPAAAWLLGSGLLGLVGLRRKSQG